MKVSRKSILWGALTAVLAIAAIMPGLQAGRTTAGRFKLQFDAQVGKQRFRRATIRFRSTVPPARTE